MFFSLAVGTWICQSSDVNEFPAKIAAERHTQNAEGSDHYRSFTQYPLNAGLPRLLTELEPPVESGNRIYVLFHRSPSNIGELISDGFPLEVFLKSQGQPDLGHVQLAWSCTVDGKIYQSATGFTGESEGQGFDLYVRGFGASALLVDYADGRLEPPWVVHVRSETSLKEGRLTGVAVSVSEDDCRSVLVRIQRFHEGKVASAFRLPDTVFFPGAAAANETSSTIRDGHNCFGFVRWVLHDVKSIPDELFRAAGMQLKIAVDDFGWPGSLPNGHTFSDDVERGLNRLGRKGKRVVFQTSGTTVEVEDRLVTLEFLDPGRAQAMVDQWPDWDSRTPWLKTLPSFPH